MRRTSTIHAFHRQRETTIAIRYYEIITTCYFSTHLHRLIYKLVTKLMGIISATLSSKEATMYATSSRTAPVDVGCGGGAAASSVSVLSPAVSSASDDRSSVDGAGSAAPLSAPTTSSSSSSSLVARAASTVYFSPSRSVLRGWTEDGGALFFVSFGVRYAPPSFSDDADSGRFCTACGEVTM